MSRIIIQNASVLTLDDSDTFLFPATVVIENDLISGIFEEIEAPKDFNDAVPTTMQRSARLRANHAFQNSGGFHFTPWGRAHV